MFSLQMRWQTHMYQKPQNHNFGVLKDCLFFHFMALYKADSIK